MITKTGIATIATVAATISNSDSHNSQGPDLPVLFDVVFIVRDELKRAEAAARDDHIQRRFRPDLENIRPPVQQSLCHS